MIEIIRVGKADVRGLGAVLYRYETERETVVEQIFLHTDLDFPAHAEHIDRTVPLVIGEQVEHKELRLAQIAALESENDAVRDAVRILFRHYSVLKAVLLVHRNAETL